jgi:MFS family permease
MAASMDRPGLWTRDFVISGFVNFFIAVNFYLLMVITSAFAIESFHSRPGEAGLASGIFVIGALVARVFCGKWIERTGRKKMLYLGLISSLIMTLMYFAVDGVIFLLVVRLLHGVAFGIASTALATIVTNIVPKGRYGEGLGYFMLSVTLAMAIGPFLGMFMARHGSIAMVFTACTISAALSFGIALFLSVPEMTLTKEQLEATKGFSPESFFEFKAIPISIVCGIMYFCYSSVLSFLAVYAREIHLADAASFFFIVFAAAVLVSRPYTGRLFDSRGENLTMYPAILTFMLGMIILSLAHAGLTLLLAGVFIGLGCGAVQSVSQAVSVKVTPPHRMGLATSTFFMFMDGGVGVGPSILGLFIPFAGYRGVYLGVAALAFACTFLYHILHGRRAVFEKVQNISAN